MPVKKTAVIRELTIKVTAMPKDSNSDGDIFGGWILSQMDLAGGMFARKVAGERVVTVAIDNLTFHLPVFIGDSLECYAELTKVGTTSLHVKVDAFVERKATMRREKVTEGKFVFVAIDEARRPTKVGPAIAKLLKKRGG